MDQERRASLRALYRATRCQIRTEGGWQALDTLPSEGMGAVITAWNPAGTKLPPAVNDARDDLLRAELAAYGLAPLRVRGNAADGSWYEDGWLVPHDDQRTLRLLRRWHQLAAYLLDRTGRSLLWSDDGAVERL